MVVDKTITVPERDHTVEIDIKTTIEEGEIITTVVVTEMIGPITGITVGPEIEIVTETAIGITIDQIIEETIVIKDMVIEAKIAVDLETEIGGIGVAPEKSSQSGSGSQNRYKSRRQSRDGTRNRDRSKSRTRSSSHVSTNRDRSRCYRCNKYNHFARECPNDNASGRNNHNAKDSLLRMSDNDPAYALDYADRGFDMDVKHVKDKNEAAASLSIHKRGGNF